MRLAVLFCFSLISLVAKHSLASPVTPKTVPRKIVSGMVTRKVVLTTTTTQGYEEEETVDLTDLSGRSWECGSDEFSKLVAKAEVDKKCPSKTDEFNSCCLAHDTCYDDQLGQTHCDDTFCSCLAKVTSSNAGKCKEETGPLFCQLVRTYGADAYRNSAPNATVEESAEESRDDYYDQTEKSDNRRN